MSYKNWKHSENTYGDEEWNHKILDYRLNLTVKETQGNRKKSMVSLKDTSQLGGDVEWAEHFNTKGDAEEFARNWLKKHPYPEDIEVHADSDYGVHRVEIKEIDSSAYMAEVVMLEGNPAAGIEAGEETWIDLENVDRAMNMLPVERKQDRRYAREQGWLE